MERQAASLERHIAELPSSAQVEIAWCAAALERLLRDYDPGTAGIALAVVMARVARRLPGGAP
jgi:hypothetical protein